MYVREYGARGKQRGFSPGAAAPPLDWTRVREISVENNFVDPQKKEKNTFLVVVYFLLFFSCV